MAISRAFRKLLGIATPVCALARNDVPIFRFYSSTYWMAMQPGPPWVVKAGLRGTISYSASGMAAFSAARAWSAVAGAAAGEI